MKIGINGYEAVIPRFGYDLNGLPKRVGSSEVCFQLISEFAKFDKENEYVIYLPINPMSDMPQEGDRFKYKIIPNKKLWTITGLTFELLKRPSLDVFFSPTHYGPLFTPCPEVISILDVSYRHFPEMFKAKDKVKLNTWGNYSISHAKRIITISESSKRDIIKEYGISGKKISVVCPGIKESLNKIMNKSEFIKKYKIEDPYILFVGTLQPRKNITRLIEAFSKLKDEKIRLVIIGRQGWDYQEILSAPERFGVSDKVRFLENVTDDDLSAFYENAEVFVLPSLYEGFGLPVLEAMKYGCPVVASNVSSLPEAGGDAALYFDPENTDDIAEKIKKVLGDKNLQARMVKEGYMQVKKFSWEKSARQVLKVFEEMVKKD